MKPHAKHPWSRGDKLLVVVPGILTVLGIGLFFWLRTLDREPAVALPPPTVMPAINARDYFLAAANAAAVTGAVGPNSRAVRLLHQGFQHPYQEPTSRVLRQRLPELRSMRILARHLAKQAKADARQSRWGASVDAGMDAFQMGVAVTHGADHFETSYGINSQYAGEESLWKVVSHLNAAEARTGARRLEAIRANRVPYVKMLQLQKISIQQELSQEMSQPNWRDDWITTTPPVLTYPRAWRNHALSTLRLRLTSKQQILSVNAKYMDALIAAAQQPYAAHSAWPPLPNDPVNQLGVPLYGDLWTDTVNLDTQNALLLTAFALRAYQLDHSKYPAALSVLVSGYLKAVTPDPFALSGALRYKRVGTKYLLYSIGPDGKDDGGKAIINSRITEDSTGDVVAGVNT